MQRSGVRCNLGQDIASALGQGRNWLIWFKGQKESQGGQILMEGDSGGDQVREVGSRIP